MKLYLNTQTGNLSTASANGQPLRRIDAKQRDDLVLEVFPDVALVEGSGLFAARTDYNQPLVALDANWDAPETENAGYVFNVSLATEELETLFSGGETEIILKGEIRWVSSGAARRTQTFDLVVARAVYLEEDALPEPATAPDFFKLTSPDGSQWEVSITNEGVLQREKLA